MAREMLGNTYIDYTSPYYKGGAVAGAIAGAAVTGGASSGASSAIIGGALGGYLAGGVTGASGSGVDAEIVVASMAAGAIGGYSYGVLIEYGIGHFGSGFLSSAIADMSYQSILLSAGRQSDYNIMATAFSGMLGGSVSKVMSNPFVDNNGLTQVSRWGRTGLNTDDWVMPGSANLENWLSSFKWQWQSLAGNNMPARYASGSSYSVEPQYISWPRGWGWDGWWKGLFGQRIYKGPPGGACQ